MPRFSPIHRLIRGGTKSGSRALSLAAILLSLPGPIQTLRAEPAPRINSVFPDCVQRGTSQTVLIEGSGLASVTQIHFSGTGLMGQKSGPPATAVSLESANGGLTVAGDNPATKSFVKIEVAANATPGTHEMRIIGAGGVSQPVLIQVDDLPQLVETEINHSTNTAQEITLPAGINGIIKSASEDDFYKFKATKGQRLIFDVIAARSGSPLDSSLALLDGGGKELVRNEDANSFDSLIDYTVPEDGWYILHIRDFRYRGGANYRYRITAGALPYLDSVFPIGGQRGKDVQISLMGRNLEANAKLSLKVKEDAPLGPMEVRAHLPTGYSNARSFLVGANPEFMETEPNNATNEANMVSLPVSINGRIQKPGDVDNFKFKVEKGQRFIFEVQASRFGSPLDALLTLTKTNGTVLQRNDDASGADAKLDQTFDEAGEYFLSIRDLLDRGGELFTYRISVTTPPPPSFQVRFSPDVPRIHRGANTYLRAQVIRQNGFGGPIEVHAAHLPQGVQADPLLIAPEASEGYLLLRASPDAMLGSSDLELEGVGVMDGTQRKRKAQPLSSDRVVKESFLTVLEPAPFSLDMVSLAASVEQDQSTTVEAKVTRAPGFQGEIKVSLEGFAQPQDGIGKSFEVSPVTLKPDQTKATFTLKAKLDSSLGTRPVFARAEAAVAGDTLLVSTPPIPVTITEFPFVLSSSLPKLTLTALPPGIKSAAGEAEFSIKVARRGLFNDDVTLALEGLPDGVVASSTNLLRNTGEAAFKLTTTDKAKGGKTNTVTVVGASTVNGRRFEQRGLKLTVVLNAPEEMTVATNSPAEKKQP